MNITNDYFTDRFYICQTCQKRNNDVIRVAVLSRIIIWAAVFHQYRCCV